MAIFPFLISLPIALIAAVIHRYILHPLFLSPLSHIPGPRVSALTKWRLAWDDWTGQRTRAIHALHAHYGPVVRIGPNEVHFNSISAQRTIYGAGSGFERTAFYRMFDAYGRKNLFTFESVGLHAGRKRMLAHAYSKSAVLKGRTAQIVGDRIQAFMDLLQSTLAHGGLEIFAATHYFAIDVISAFLYGATQFGATSALQGDTVHRALLQDIMDPARRRLSWFAVHLPSLTTWLYTRSGIVERLVRPLLPMRKPATYSGIRAHALQAMHTYRDASALEREVAAGSMIERLWTAKKGVGLDDLDVASECADHLLAGIDTTSDTLMFAIWCLSLPCNAGIQARLVDECRALPASAFTRDAIDLDTADAMPYLSAVLKETLRLFTPLPASEPRSSPVDTEIDGLKIPRGTVCSMAPFSLHRDERVFPSPLKWDPHRWLIDGDEARAAEVKKWFWAFSSGARMCIGMQ